MTNDLAGTLADLRCAGWMVAVHNDYRLDGVPMTFWLLTHPDGRYVKGEGMSDAAALRQCEAAIREGTPSANVGPLIIRKMEA